MTAEVYSFLYLCLVAGWPFILLDTSHSNFILALLANSTLLALNWHYNKFEDLNLFRGFQILSSKMMSGCANITLLYLPLALSFYYVQISIWTIISLLQGSQYAQKQWIELISRTIGIHLNANNFPSRPQNHSAQSNTTTIIAFIIILAVIVWVSSRLSNTSESSNQPTLTPIATNRPHPTQPPAITLFGSECIPWNEVNASLLGAKICVYGQVHDVSPNTNEWNTIYFGPRADDFRVIDFNYSWVTPLHMGQCVVVYGTIRDYGPHLMITPDKDLQQAITRCN